MGKIAKIWLPVLLTRVLMAVEFTLLSAVIAVFTHDVLSVAVFAFIYSVFVTVESPFMMLDGLSVKYADDPSARTMMAKLSLFLTLPALLLFAWILFHPTLRERVGGLALIDADIWQASTLSLVMLISTLPLLTYRRIRQGVMIAHQQGGAILVALVIKVIVMVLFAIGLMAYQQMNAYQAASFALAASIWAESLYVLGVSYVQKKANCEQDAPKERAKLTYQRLLEDSLPLAMISFASVGIVMICVLALSTHSNPVMATAVFSLSFWLTMIIKSIAISFQAMLINQKKAILHQQEPPYNTLSLSRIFKSCVGLSIFLAFAFCTFVQNWYFIDFNNIDSSYSILALWVSCFLASSAILTFEVIRIRANLIVLRENARLNVATIMEVSTVTLVILFGYVMTFNVVLMCAIAVCLGRVMTITVMQVGVKNQVNTMEEKAKTP